jgi:hypothetical protein
MRRWPTSSEQSVVKATLITQDYNKDFSDAGKGGRQGYFPAVSVEHSVRYFSFLSKHL